MVAVRSVPVVEPPVASAGHEPGCVTVGGFDGSGLAEAPLEVLERALVHGWREQSAHLSRWLAVLAVFDEREGWGGIGIQSCAHWLSINCGISPGTAADHVRVARRLQALPEVAAAFTAGRITYSKVRAICRVATPDTQTDLLELAADTSAGQLERVLRVVERQRRGETVSDDEKDMRRCVHTWTDDDGMGHLEVIAHPDEIEVLRRGIDFGRDQLYQQRREAEKASAADVAGGCAEDGGRLRREAPSRVDSLLWTVKAGLDRLESDPTYTPSSPYVVMIHVREGSAFVRDDGMVELSGGFVIHPRRLQELACDSTLRLLIHGRDGDESPLDVGRTKRLATEKQRTALLAVYDTCDFEDCGVPARFCQFHHIDHWTKGGATDRANLRPMCKRHHRLAHSKDVRVVIGPRNHLIALQPDNTARALGVAGNAFAGGADTDGSELVFCNLHADIDLHDPDEHDALRARWGGEPLNDFAADVIISNLLRRLDQSDAAAAHGADDELDGGQPRSHHPHRRQRR